MFRELWLPALIISTMGLTVVDVVAAQVPKDRAMMMRAERAQLKPDVVNPRTLQMVSPFVYGMRKEITDSSGQGPNFDRPITLISTISTSRSIDLELKDVLNIFEDVYPDNNPSSGLF